MISNKIPMRAYICVRSGEFQQVATLKFELDVAGFVFPFKVNRYLITVNAVGYV